MTERRKKALQVAETLGFALNVSVLRSIYERRLEQSGQTPEEVEQLVIERGQFWRFRMLAGSLATGTLGYMLRDLTVAGNILMYGSLLVIAIHLKSGWLAKPGLSAKHLLSFKKGG